MHIYWLLVLTCLPLLTIKKNKVYYLFFLALFVSIFSAFQSGSVSADRDTYLDFFQFFSNPENQSPSFSMEPFFYIIFKMFNSSLELNVFAFFLICFLGVAVKFHLMYKYSPDVGLSVLLFFTYLFLLQDMNQIRSGLAIGFIYLAMLSYFYGSNTRWLLFSILALCFHYSAIIVFLTPLFILKNLTQKKLIIILTLIACFSIFWIYLGLATKIMDIIAGIEPTGKLRWYLNSLDNYAVNPVKRLLPHFLFLIPIILKYDLLYKKNPSVKFFIQLYLLYIISFLILSPIPVLAYRISDIFLFSSVFVLPSLFLVIKEKLFAKMLVVLFSFFQFIYVVYVLDIFGPYSLIM